MKKKLLKRPLSGQMGQALRLCVVCREYFITSPDVLYRDDDKIHGTNGYGASKARLSGTTSLKG